MRTNTYIIDTQQENLIANLAALEIFGAATIIEQIEQNSHDRSYTKIGANDIKSPYAKLPKQDLAYVLEGHIINVLERLLWGHRFVVDVKIHQYDHNGDYEFYVCIMPLKECVN